MNLRLFLLLFASATLSAQDARVDSLLDRIFKQEQNFLQFLATQTPLVETYIQEVESVDTQEIWRPTRDHYFLGRVKFSGAVQYQTLLGEKSEAEPSRRKNKALLFLPRGFAQMAAIDLQEFNAAHYRLEYVQREFLGEARTLVFDVLPIGKEQGRFTGRVWVEERSTSIVRFNGTYLQAEKRKPSSEQFFHFDSWRGNAGPGLWIPTRVYIEEQTDAIAASTKFKAQTRFWNYTTVRPSNLDELTQVVIEQATDLRDRSVEPDLTPFESQRAWERQAEQNLLSRLEKSGLLAPAGPVNEVLNTVLNNLVISAGLNVDAQCRVLLTTPLETFSIGHTIVISRGMIDVLPDEASLALALADELAHIALGHRTPTQFSFHNQTMVDDAELLPRLRLNRTKRELDEAGAKTIEIMKASPYQKSGAGLFLKALATHAASLPNLLVPNLGNQVANTTTLNRLAEFIEAAPDLEENRIEQIAALPLGSRIKLNPWNDQISLLPTKPVSLISVREKIPFEIAPVFEYLTLTPDPKP